MNTLHTQPPLGGYQDHGWGRGTRNLEHSYWLVVDLPLWKIWKSVGMIIPNIWKNKKCSKPPTSVYIIIYIYLEKSISYGTKMANENVTSSAFFSERPNRPTPSSKPARKADSTKGFGCSQVASQNFGKTMGKGWETHQILAENQEVP